MKCFHSRNYLCILSSVLLATCIIISFTLWLRGILLPQYLYVFFLKLSFITLLFVTPLQITAAANLYPLSQNLT